MYTMIYDNDCGFCKKSAEWMVRLSLSNRVEVKPNGPANLEHYRVPLGRSRYEMVLVHPDGSLEGGYRAFRTLGWFLPIICMWVPVCYLPPVEWVGQKVYRWIVRNRHRMLGGEGTCPVEYPAGSIGTMEAGGTGDESETGPSQGAGCGSRQQTR